MAKSLREKCLARDEYKCVLCGTSEKLQAHHIVHRQQGGLDALSNLATLCSRCHFALHLQGLGYHFYSENEYRQLQSTYLKIEKVSEKRKALKEEWYGLWNVPSYHGLKQNLDKELKRLTSQAETLRNAALDRYR